jgi:hypothetical protein
MSLERQLGGRNLIVLFICMIKTSFANAAPLTENEKLAFMRGSVSSCIAKNNIALQPRDPGQRNTIQLYCTCHASTVAGMVTKQELNQISRGIVPDTFPAKVQRARENCLKALR